MVRSAWIVFGASACGAATATFLGGASAWGLFLTLGTLVVALGATVLSRLGRSSTDAPIDHERLTRQRLAHEQFDDNLVAQIRATAGEREIDWLSRQDFESTWRDTPVTSLRSLRHLDGLAAGPFEDELRHLVERLDATNTAFLDYYETKTQPDSLLTETEWREIASGSTDVESRHRVQGCLVSLASAVVGAHSDLFEFQSRTRRPSPSRRTA